MRVVGVIDEFELLLFSYPDLTSFLTSYTFVYYFFSCCSCSFRADLTLWIEFSSGFVGFFLRCVFESLVCLSVELVESTMPHSTSIYIFWRDCSGIIRLPCIVIRSVS